MAQREEVARTRFRKIVDGFYGGLTGLAVSELISSDDSISEDELQAIEDLVRQRRGEKSG